jgi:hypothetical protein
MQGMKESFSNWHYQCQQGFLDEELCQTGYRIDVMNILPVLRAMNIDLTNTRSSFVADLREIARQNDLPVPNEDGTW